MLDDIIHRRLRTPYTLHIEKLRTPKRPRSTIVMIHGIGSSTLMWHKVAQDVPNDVQVIAVDLLGFGKSPYPTWAKYDVATQTRSLIKTLILHRVPLGSIIVGHSLGALVAVELARRFPLYPARLVLVSPPIYKPSRGKVVATQREDILRGVYKILQRYPKNTERALRIAKKYYIKRSGLTVTPGININSYLLTLESAIINQDTIDHITQVRAPITILSGTRDPLVIEKNLQDLALSSHNIRHVSIKKAGHNVVGAMRAAVVYQVTQPRSR